MILYKHDFKEKTIMELEGSELLLIAFLLERSSRKMKGLLDDPLAGKMNKEMQIFLSEWF